MNVQDRYIFEGGLKVCHWAIVGDVVYALHRVGEAWLNTDHALRTQVIIAQQELHIVYHFPDGMEGRALIVRAQAVILQKDYADTMKTLWFGQTGVKV